MVELKINQFLDGILDMTKGKLSQHILSTYHARQILQQITQKLRKHDPPVYLAQQDPSHYFQFDLFAIRRHQINIYVTWVFPISAYEESF